MRKLLISLIFIVSAVGCRSGKHQIVQLKNSSSETIYYLISQDSVLINPIEIASIRPKSIESFIEKELREVHVKNQADSLERLKNHMYRYRIEKDDSVILLSSQSAGIFIDSTPIQSVIKNIYDGRVNIFTIKEIDLEKFSDEEIAGKKYSPFISLTEAHITSDSLMLEYK